jgi:hypothetical protein
MSGAKELTQVEQMNQEIQMDAGLFEVFSQLQNFSNTSIFHTVVQTTRALLLSAFSIPP